MEKIINRVILKSVSSFKIYALSINIDEQTYAIFPCKDTLLKSIPKDVGFIPLPSKIIVNEIKVSGIDTTSGISSILFYPDGTKEPAEIFVTDFSDNKNYEIKIEPYSLAPTEVSYE